MTWCVLKMVHFAPSFFLRIFDRRILYCRTFIMATHIKHLIYKVIFFRRPKILQQLVDGKEIKAYEKPTCYKILVYKSWSNLLKKIIGNPSMIILSGLWKSFFYHDILSTYCLWVFHICNSINHLEKETLLKYKLMHKPSKHWKSLGKLYHSFQEFHLGFQTDPL